MGFYQKIKRIVTRDKRDAGMWIQKSRFGKWIEDESEPEEFYITYEHQRAVTSNTKVIFYQGGFPRQGNTTLRRILLNTFPEMAMPDVLTHAVSLAQKATLDKKIIFMTIRNPHDALLSLVSMNIELSNGNKFTPQLSNKKKKYKIDAHINFYIRYCQFIKDNIKNITVIPFEKIVQISDDYISGSIENNETIQCIADKYNLSINPPGKGHSHINIFSTSNKDVERLYLSSSYYKRKLKKANKIYKKIMKLTS